MTSSHAKTPELLFLLFMLSLAAHLLKTLLFLSLTICQGSIIICGLKQKFHLTTLADKDISFTSLTNNNYSNLPHEGKVGGGKAFMFCSLFCIMEHTEKKWSPLGIKK